MEHYEYQHYNQFPMDKWRWPSFTPKEIACRGDNKLMIDYDAMDKLQALRNKLGRPMYINSAYRSPEYNRRIGGAKRSKHMSATAFDCRMVNQSTDEYVSTAKSVGFKGFGYYPKSNFIHIDTGPARSWGRFWSKDNRKGRKEAIVEASPSPTPVTTPTPRPASPAAPVSSKWAWLFELIRRLFA